jgi:hypothetical protein
MAAARCPPRSEARHNARSLGLEIEVFYPFHPLCGRTATIVGDQTLCVPKTSSELMT